MQLRLSWGAVVAMWLATAAAAAHAQVTTQESASVIVFPKVLADGDWDTTIQIANGANRPTYAVCHYVNGQLTNPDQPPGSINPPLWLEVDFPIFLVPLQPTHWVVSRGRSIGPTEECSPTGCDAAGLLPGRVPAVPEDFIGELLCYEVDASGARWSGNALRGQATLTNLETGEVVKYPAIGLSGLPTNDANGRLCLGGEASAECPLGAEYSSCPGEWIVSHPSNFDDRPTDRSASRTRLTVVPCTQDFANEVPAQVTLQFLVTNELEQAFSASTTVRCWADFDLSDVNTIFDRDFVGGDWLQTRVTTAASGQGGFMLVQQTVRQHARPPSFTAVASTAHQNGNGEEVDIITVPEGGVQ